MANPTIGIVAAPINNPRTLETAASTIHSSAPAFADMGRALGRALVRGMPVFLTLLTTVGTAAMIWVGGGFVLHGLKVYGPPSIGSTVHAAAETAAHALPSAVAESFQARGIGHQHRCGLICGFRCKGQSSAKLRPNSPP